MWYSWEARKKAIDLYIKYGKSVSAAIYELGYPSRHALTTWYQEYLESNECGDGEDPHKRKPRYTLEQKQAAVKHYIENGRNFSRTIREMGYPTVQGLHEWVEELSPYERKIRPSMLEYAVKGGLGNMKRAEIQLTEERVKMLRMENEALQAEKQRLGEEKQQLRERFKEEQQQLVQEKQRLQEEKQQLVEEKKRLGLEIAIMKMTEEILKKGPGADQNKLTNKEKTMLIDALRSEYPLPMLIKRFRIARSSYHYQRNALSRPDKHARIRIDTCRIFGENSGRYGYRRIHAMLRRSGMKISEKVVQRIMKEESLFVVCKRRRKYSSYRGEGLPAADNLLNRDFHADAPNEKWLTDITEFHLPAGKVYLSPIVDCFDGLITSWAIGTSPDAELVNTMLDRAVATLGKGERPLVHSDRGGHYRWPGWLTIMESAGLTRSMSKKACSPDNAACEGFFGRLKNEMFYNKSWHNVTTSEFMDILDRYLVWYNERRIKISLGAMSPLEYRRSLGFVA
jgi:transposase InsO family protein